MSANTTAEGAEHNAEKPSVKSRAAVWAGRAGKVGRWGLLAYRLTQHPAVRDALDVVEQVAAALVG